MNRYTIGEVAERTGFTASALRYYEGIGIVNPSARSDGGYRLYDDRALGRLAFIARAKQLGCSLEEITDLVSIWDGDQCGPVQDRLHELISEKIVMAERHVDELNTLVSQLRIAATRLAGPAIDGPCRSDCACLTSGMDESGGESFVCTLDPAARPARLEAWRAVLEQARSRAHIADGAVRFEFGPDVDVEALAALAGLAAAEQDCCSFLAFAVTIDGRGVGLEVHTAGRHFLASETPR